jgi:hypothetical protein
MRPWRSTLLLLALVVPAGAAPAPEKEVATLDLAGKAPVTLTVLRQRLADGGLKLTLRIAGKGDKKPRSVVLYEGGPDEDGPVDKSFRAATVEPFTLPGGKRGARVDFEFQVPGSKKHRQVDAYLVGIDEPKLVLEATVRRERDRTKVCHEVEEASLSLEKDGRLVASSMSALESELNDDDLPIDKTCKGRHPNAKTVWKWDGEAFLQIDPPPAPKKKAAESDD